MYGLPQLVLKHRDFLDWGLSVSIACFGETTFSGGLCEVKDLKGPHIWTGRLIRLFGVFCFDM